VAAADDRNREAPAAHAPIDQIEGEFDPYALINPYDRQARSRKRYAKAEWRRLQYAQAQSQAKTKAQAKTKGQTEAGASPAAGRGDAAEDAGPSPATGSPGQDDFEAWVKRVDRRRRLVWLVLATAALLIIGSTGSFIAYDTLRVADISAYAQTGISVSGLADEDFIVTPGMLSDHKVTQTAAAASGKGAQGESKAGTVNAYGPTLETFLAGYGHTISDFRTITFYCKDGYTTVLRPSRMESDEVIMSFASGKEPLPPYQWPLRLVIPAEDTGKWCFGILRIEFTLDDGEDGDGDGDGAGDRAGDGGASSDGAASPGTASDRQQQQQRDEGGAS
jgi:hypothetical protein